jgi:hypothetical protein
VTTFSWIFAGIALIGVVLNILKKRSCFYLWIISNAGNALYALHKEAWSLSILFTVYFILAIWGALRWKA